jgi:hypothetical protein
MSSPDAANNSVHLTVRLTGPEAFERLDCIGRRCSEFDPLVLRDIRQILAKTMTDVQLGDHSRRHDDPSVQLPQ